MLFDRAEWLGPGVRNLSAADFDGDGAMDLIVPGGSYSDFKNNRLAKFVPVKLPLTFNAVHAEFWQPVDWNGDGNLDVLVGASDTRDYNRARG